MFLECRQVFTKNSAGSGLRAMTQLLAGNSKVSIGKVRIAMPKVELINWAIGQIHLDHLWIRKYFMDDSSVNFHDKFFSEF